MFKKNDGFDSNGVIDLREKKDGFWTNGGLEFDKKKWVWEQRCIRFDRRMKEKRWGLERMVE